MKKTTNLKTEKLWSVKTIEIKQKSHYLWILHKGSTKFQKSCENYSMVADSDISALNFDNIYQLNWESDKKGGIV